MGLSDLPPELRSTIYTYWVAGYTFKKREPILPPSTWLKLFGESWLSDAFTISKSIACDPWLTEAILRHSTFHLETPAEFEILRNRFGDAGLNNITHISLGKAMIDDTVMSQIRSLMPKLKHVRLEGDLSPMWRVWNNCLENFDRHAWAQFVTCLCIFTPGQVPGPNTQLTELVLNGSIELMVDFMLDDDLASCKRKMQFSSKDWLLRYAHGDKQYSIKQVQPVDLPAVLEEEKAALLT